MTLAGLWHGAGWNFLAWGALHGVGLAVERAARGVGRTLAKPLAITWVFAFVTLLWIPFRAPDFNQTLAYLAAFTRVEGYAPVALTPLPLVLIAIGLAMNAAPTAWLGRTEAGLARLPATIQAALLAAVTLTLFAAAQEGTAPFIYFQF